MRHRAVLAASLLLAASLAAGCAAPPAPLPLAAPAEPEAPPGRLVDVPVDLAVPLGYLRTCLVAVCLSSGFLTETPIALGRNATVMWGNLTLTVPATMPPQSGVSWWVACDAGWDCTRAIGSAAGPPPLSIRFDAVPHVGDTLWTTASLEGPLAPVADFMGQDARVNGTLRIRTLDP